MSASEHPNHFWIQIIGSRSLQLDKLVSEMTQHYENSLVSYCRDRVGFDEKGAFFIVICSLFFLGNNYLFFLLLVFIAYLFFSLPILTLPILIPLLMCSLKT